MGTPYKYSKDMCEIATRVLASGESLAAVCAELDITRTTLYEWRDSHPDFKSAIEKGLEKAQRDWEAIGRSGIIGDLDKFNASSWIFTMKNRFRNDYRDDKKEDDKSDQTSVLEKILNGEIKIKHD